MQDGDFLDEVNKIVKVKVPLRHTFFQLNHFVINKEPTHQAKLRKCVEELRAKKQELGAIDLEICETEDKNEIIKIEIDKIECSGKEKEIKLRMANRRIIQNNRTIDTLRERHYALKEEMLFFVKMFNKLSETEPLKDWDDPSVQGEFWNAKIAEEVGYKLLMQMPIDLETIKTALALPAESPVRKQISLLLQKSKALSDG